MSVENRGGDRLRERLERNRPVVRRPVVPGLGMVNSRAETALIDPRAPHEPPHFGNAASSSACSGVRPMTASFRATRTIHRDGAISTGTPNGNFCQ
ncbi:hypothetical protein ACFPRL_30135 [Pseudoclavibacter helvolus]